jgi:putative hydrolase of the HAD superfamily
MLRQHLLVDADDTLWENIVVFHQIEADFLSWLNHPDGELEARRVLEDIQGLLIAAHGYGTNTFVRALEQTYRHIAAREPDDADLEMIRTLTQRLQWEELELIEGVADTLERLSTRHDLLLVTKGDFDEQRRKIEISGLESFFRETVIVPEKDEAVYRSIVDAEGLPVERTWMIGNSPKSDILPAVAAGIRAVYVPHAFTWAREHRELPEDDRILVVESFTALLRYF